MKRILFIFTIILCAALTSCRAQNPFQEVADMDGVQTVYVGKAMMKLANGLVNDELGKLAGDIESVLVLNIENKKAIQKAKEMVAAYVSQNFLEQLLVTNEKNESTCIYGLPSDNGKNLREMLLHTIEPTESNLILIKGKISMDQIAQFAGNSVQGDNDKDDDDD